MTTGYGGTIILGPAAGAGFGSSVAAIGDVNGDGHQDFAIAAPLAEDQAGQVFVLYGGQGDLAQQMDLGGLLPDGTRLTVVQGGLSGDGLGSMIGRAGDLDHDGIDDLLISAGPGRQAYVIYGNQDGLGAVVNLNDLEPGQATALLLPEGVDAGLTLEGLGDLNGDGYQDVLVSDPALCLAHILFGDGARQPDSLMLLVSEFSGNEVYQNVSGGFALGDLNKDGLADLGLQTAEGLVVLFGSSAMGGRIRDLAAVTLGDTTGFLVPLAAVSQVRRLADINGDGIDDLLIEGRADSLAGETTSYVLFGRRNGFGASFDLADLDGTNGFSIEGTGLAAGGRGDVNGDGRRDLLVAGDGKAYLILTPAQGFAAHMDPDSLNGSTGYVIEGLAGDQVSGGQLVDVNDDGFADLLLALPGRSGAAILYGGPARLAALDAADGQLDGHLHLSALSNLLSFTEPEPVPVGSGNSGREPPTRHDDTLIGTSGVDEVDLLAGDDSFGALSGDDKVLGGLGRDSIFGDTGNDSLFGGAQNDLLSGSTGDDLLTGGEGRDLAEGGAGNDVYGVDNAFDRVIEIARGGRDRVQSSVHWVLGAQTEDLRLTGSAALRGEGNSRNNRLQGNDGDNVLKGQGGADVVMGGRGDDVLSGGAGRDVLFGGKDRDADRFVFHDISESGPGGLRDVIHDFRRFTDAIDLHLVDANINKPGNQRFHFAGGEARAYALWWADVGQDLLLKMDTNGDAKADMEIRLVQVNNIASTDLLL
jgi:Ca2+-binding RTX toxin-like protein